MMYFRYKDTIKTVNVETTRSNLRPFIFEGASFTHKEDTIKATFDAKHFKYPLLKGYLPWGFQFKSFRRQTNLIQINTMIMMLILITSR